jgi:membrane protein
VLESAFNIVYGKPNRSFLHGKLVAVTLLVGSLITLFVGLIAGSVGYRVLRRFVGGFFENEYVAYGASVLISTISVFIFLFSVYYLLTNEKLTVREVLPGTIVATIVLETSFQLLPLYLRISNDVIALQAFGAPALLLVWLYLMANVIVFGAEINWYRARGRRREAVELEEAAGLA